jgi:uncharacterized protein (TIGR00369 family)
MPYYKHLGITLHKMSYGESVIQVNVTRKLTQSAGFAHGGVSASLIDSAVGLALLTMLGGPGLITTIELKVNFIAPAKPGVLKASGRILHKGARTAVGEADVKDRNGLLIAKGLVTYMILGEGV